MCGIAGFILNPKYRGSFPADKFSRELLLGIENRGKHATGMLSVCQGKNGPSIHFDKEPIPASEFVKEFEVDKRANIALLHTRYKTKGDPKHKENNHPVVLKTCFVVHNGSIHNDDNLIERAQVNRIGEVDSFAIPVVLETNGWNTRNEIKKSLGELHGAFAIAAADPVEKPGRVLLAKGDGVPLHVLHVPQGIIWASEEKAIVDAWGKILGTPPTRKGRRAGSLGMHSISPGEFWLIIRDEAGIHIEPGLFTVNRSWFSSNNNSQREAQRALPRGNSGGRRTRRQDDEVKDWSCWPNDKTCVFGHDCGNCRNGQCRCYDGNPDHPRLNPGMNYKDMIHHKDTGQAFHRWCQQHHITEDMISPLGDQPGSASSSVSKSPNSTVLRSDSQEWSPRQHVFSSCSVCTRMGPENVMQFLGWAHNRPILVCATCQEYGNTPDSPGHDTRLDPVLRRFYADGKIAMGMVDQAVSETAFEFKIEQELVRYICLFQPIRPDIPDYFKFQKEVRQSFASNLNLMQELKALEAVE